MKICGSYLQLGTFFNEGIPYSDWASFGPDMLAPSKIKLSTPFSNDQEIGLSQGFFLKCIDDFPKM